VIGDGGVARYAELAEAACAAPPRLGPVRAVAVDGPSGSGKTLFAARLADALNRAAPRGGPDGGAGGVAVVHTDELLDGWDDQVTFWPRLEEWVLGPLRSGRAGALQVYDWVAGRRRVDWKPVPVTPVLIIEGVTAARAALRPELSLVVFLTAPLAVRTARVLDRDGAQVRADLLRWQRGEDAFFAADRTARHADVVVDGAPTVAHDPELEYVQSG